MPLFFVYVLRSQKDGKFYTGSTAAIERRFMQHQLGMNVSTYHRRPFILIYYEVFINKHDAKRRERYFKSTKGKVTLRQMLHCTLEQLTST